MSQTPAFVGWGEAAPHFISETDANPRFHFGTVAGRYIVLCLYATAADPEVGAALAQLEKIRALFDDTRASFFGVTRDPADVAEGRATDHPPGIRFFRDYDGEIARSFGAADAATWIVLDPQLRALARLPLARTDAVIAHLLKLPTVAQHAGVEISAPVLILPRVFEPAFCKHLIDYYEERGGEESGFMRDIDGTTRIVFQHSHKRRSDAPIEDAGLQKACAGRMARRLVPEIARAFQFKVTHIERYLVACYDASVGAHFAPHRDNTTKGTAHRRFAVTINLNPDGYEGGDLCFPEFGPRTYRAPLGGAVVFSCSLLHQALPVTKGRRYAFLPFLYDEPAAQLRQQNLPFVEAAAGGTA
jgi:peroxiredoxin